MPLPDAAFDDVLAANARFSEGFADTGLPGTAARGLAVVTCMDSRIDPLGALGLRPGDAKVLRSAGARVTDDVLRGLVVAVGVLGVDRVLVMAHTDCGMAKLGEQDLHARLRERGVDTRSLDFAVVDDQARVLRADVQRVRSWPFLPAGVLVAGGVYDVRTGRLSLVDSPGAD